MVMMIWWYKESRNKYGVKKEKKGRGWQWHRYGVHEVIIWQMKPIIAIPNTKIAILVDRLHYIPDPVLVYFT